MSTHSRRPSRRFLVPAAVTLGLGAATAIVGGAVSNVSAAPGDTTVQLLSFNDYHGHVEADTPGSIDGSFGGPDAGGGEYLSTKLTELRDASTADDSFTVAAGDLIGGSPFFSGLFHDEPSVESLNEMDLDFSGVGNHEFDEGVTELIRMQNGGCHPVDGCYFAAPYGGADFQWLAANVVEDAPDGTDDFVDSIPPYEIVPLSNGKSIAFIGMTLEGTDELVAAAGIQGFSFQDEILAAKAAADAIQAEDATVEAMVLLLHEGGIPSPFAINGCQGISGPIVDIAEGLDSRVDAIITGHTHQPYTCEFDDPADDPRPVVSAFSFGRVVTEVVLEVNDTTGEVDRSTFTMENHPVLQDELDPDPAVTAVLDKWAPLAEAIGASPVGSVTETITRGGDPTGSDRGVESAAGNLVADAQLAATQTLTPAAQIAFMNPGGVRSDLEYPESDGEGDGVVTFGEAFTFQPFNNTMFVLPMTGAQIQSVLEEQCQPGDSSRPVLHLGVSKGFRYDMEITLQAGVCTGIEVSNLVLNGMPIDPATTYNVAVNNFLADGGDNFETFAEVLPTDRVPGPQDIDALTDYLGANSPVEPPSTNRVNETITVLPSPTESYTPARLLETREGDEFTTVDGEFEGGGPVATGDTVELVVADRGGLPSDPSAVVLNIAVIRPETNGFITVHSCDDERPLAANANYAAGAIVSNQVLAEVSSEGTVCIYTSSSAELTADVNAAVPAGGSPTPVSPARLLETRVGGPEFMTIDGEFEGDGPIGAGETLVLEVAGRGGVASDAKAAVLNVATVNPPTNGFLTIYDCDGDLPLAASVNYLPNGVRSNSVTAGIGADGNVCIYASQPVEVVVDVNAYVPPSGSPDPIDPARLLETRVGDEFETVDGEFEGDGPISAAGTIQLDVAGRGGVDAAAVSALLNVAIVGASGNGFATVYPCDEDRPTTAAVNYAAGQVSSNAVTAKIDGDGKVCVYSSAMADVVVDVAAAIPPVVPAVPAS